MAAVLESIVGPWGSIFIRVGVIVSVLGAYLAWTLMAAEVLYIPAKTDDMPRFVARTNSHGAPVAALIMAAGLLKLTITRETYGDEKSFVPDMIVAAVATVYTLFLIYAAGVDKLLLSCILYAPAAALYFKARCERGLRVFRPAEAVLFGVIVLGAVAGVVSLATGAIEI
jgi:arginine:ornithine antiporter / lysine permease